MARSLQARRSSAILALSVFVFTSLASNAMGGVSAVETAVAQEASSGQCIDRISVQDSYSLLKANSELYFHRMVHKLNLGDWFSVSDNRPWGTNEPIDIDLTETPKGLGNPTTPAGIVSHGDNVWWHRNLIDLATNNWESFNSNKPWGNGTVSNVGIAGHPNDNSIRAVVSSGDRVFFLSSALISNPFGSFNWGDVSDNKPWGSAAVTDVDVNSDGIMLVSAGGRSYTHISPLNLAANDWVLANEAIQSGGQLTGIERLDFEYRPAIASKATDIFYIQWPLTNAAGNGWNNINDNKPWGSAHVDDVAVFFWMQEEPWNTPAIVMNVSGNTPYLHWHPDNTAGNDEQHQWLNVSDNAPWNLPGGPCNPVQPNADLEVVKTGPATVTRGNVLSYSIKVKNNGPAVATNVVVTDTFTNNVPGVSFTQATPAGLCSVNGNTVTCNVGTLTVGQEVTIGMNFQVQNIVQECQNTQIVNQASVSGNPNDLNTTNNISSVTTSIICQPPSVDVQVVKQGSQSVVRGNDITYTINSFNAGTSPATNVVITDVIPQGTVFKSASNNCNYNSQTNTVTCNIGTINPNSNGAPVSITVGTEPIPQCQTVQIPNTATISSDQSDTNTSNNTSTITTTVTCPPVLTNVSIVKNGPSEVIRGQQFKYFISVINLGPGVAQNVVMTDTVPNGLNIVSVLGNNCQVNGNTVSCNIGTLQAGEFRNFEITVVAPGPGQGSECQQATVSNQATVTTSSAETDTSNNQSSIVPTFIKCSTVTSSSSSSAISSVTSSAVSSTVSSVASSVTSSVASSVTSTVPGSSSSSSSVSSTVSSVTSSTAPGNGCIIVQKETFTTTGSPLTPVAQFTFTLDGTRQAQNNGSGIAQFDNVSPGQHIVSEFLPSGWTQQLVTPASGIVNVNAGASCAVVNFKNRQVVPQTPTFTLSKTDGKTIVKSGDTSTYSITVTNVSQTEAQNVEVVDTLPSQVTFQSASDAFTRNGNTITWTIPSIPAGQSRTLQVTVIVNAVTTANVTLLNTARVGTVTAEDTTIVTVDENDDIEISIKDNPDPVRPGKELVYSIEVCNEGDEDIETDVLQVLPDDVDFEEASGEDSEDEIDEDEIEEDDGTITWEDVEIDEDECIDLESIVTVDDDADDGDKLHTVATADGASDEEVTRVEDDEDDDDDDDDDNDDEGLSITKDADSFEVFPGGTISYTLTIENTGSATLEDIDVRDVLQGAGVTVLDDGGADRTGTTLSWTIDELKAGKSETFHYRVIVDTNAFIGESVINRATAKTDDLEDEDTVTVTVIGELPQTGIGLGGNGQNYLRPYTASKGGNGAATLPLVVTLAVSGISAGIGLGRKFLI